MVNHKSAWVQQKGFSRSNIFTDFTEHRWTGRWDLSWVLKDVQEWMKQQEGLSKDLVNAGTDPLAMQTEEIWALEEAAGPFSSCLSYVHCLNIRIKHKDEGFHEDERAFSILSKEHLVSNSSSSAEGPNILGPVSQPLKYVSLSAKWQELLLMRLLQVNWGSLWGASMC